jgi:hypothetical protein
MRGALVVTLVLGAAMFASKDAWFGYCDRQFAVTCYSGLMHLHFGTFSATGRHRGDSDMGAYRGRDGRDVCCMAALGAARGE